MAPIGSQEPPGARRSPASRSGSTTARGCKRALTRDSDQISHGSSGRSYGIVFVEKTHVLLASQLRDAFTLCATRCVAFPGEEYVTVGAGGYCLRRSRLFTGPRSVGWWCCRREGSCREPRCCSNS